MPKLRRFHYRPALALAALVAVASWGCASGCNPTPKPPPGPTGGTGGADPGPVGGSAGTGGSQPQSLCERVCQHLGALGCVEGQASGCVGWCIQQTTDPRFILDTGCLLDAPTKVVVRECKSVICQ